MGESGGLRAVGGVGLDGDRLIDDGIVGVSTGTSNEAGLGGGDESEDGEESLNSLHFDY